MAGDDPAARRGARRVWGWRHRPQRPPAFILGALQGALLVKRTTQDASQLRDVIAALKAQLAA